jgi:DNA-binding transcriptional regulator YhcF (GntR family)
VTEDQNLIESAKRGLAERHIKSFREAMLRLGYRQEEIVSLLAQETEKEDNDDSSGM